MDREVRHFVIPLSKDKDGNYRAILTDDSLDRDGEFMGRALINKWATSDGALPMLANHENSMQSFIGGWTDRELVESKDGHVGLAMKPNFFSKDANPLAEQIKKQIDEALAIGLNPGISIGFIPLQGNQTERGYEHTDAEIVEASHVPVQSNRNAYSYMAKRFGIEHTIKKGTDVIGASGKMEEKTDASPEKKEPDPMAMMAEMQSQFQAMKEGYAQLAERVAALEAAKGAESQEDAKAKEEAAKAAAEAETKKAEQEKKISDELEKVKADLAKMKEAVHAPKARIPGAMLGSAGLSKESGKEPEKFDAAREYARKKGILTE